MGSVIYTRREHLRFMGAAAAAGLVTTGCTSDSEATSPVSGTECRGPTVNVFPGPGTPVVSQHTQVSFRGQPASKLGRIRVVGAESGEHRGKLRAHSDGNGASFVPDAPFEAGEEVTVHSGVNVRGAGCGSFSFTIGNFTQSLPPPLKEKAGGPREVQSFRFRPDLKPPAVTVNTDTDPEELEYIFVSPQAGARPERVDDPRQARGAGVVRPAGR